ncbi:MAG: amidohydrolase family protein [Pirellulaceae bacterium]|nr:amidohydrolase family protein [Pirellulaceae bacterium]
MKPSGSTGSILAFALSVMFLWSGPTSTRADQNLSSTDSQADLIIVNGRLFGAESATATALAVRGQRILAAGSQVEIEKLVGPKTIRMDAQGGTVCAGLHDAHVHFLSGSLSLAQIDLASAENVANIERLIGEFKAAHPDQPVYQGRGWLYGAFPGGLPDKQLLDRLISDRPAILRCYDGHTVWVNSKALEAAGITLETPDPPAGIIVRDPVTKAATGVLKESAQSLIDKVLPTPTRTEKLAALRAGIRAAHRLGVTSVCEAGIGLAELELL